MGKIKTSRKNLASPGAPLSPEEFSLMISEAEKGPFYSVQEVAKKIDHWKSKIGK